MTIKNFKNPSGFFPGADGPITTLMKQAIKAHNLKEPREVTDNRQRMAKWNEYAPRDRSNQLRDAVLEAITNDTDPITDPTVIELSARQALANITNINHQGEI